MERDEFPFRHVVRRGRASVLASANGIVPASPMLVHTRRPLFWACTKYRRRPEGRIRMPNQRSSASRTSRTDFPGLSVSIRRWARRRLAMGSLPKQLRWRTGTGQICRFPVPDAREESLSVQTVAVPSAPKVR